MKARCPNCKETELVHRASFMRGRIPKCKKCGHSMEPTESARREIRSRVRETLWLRNQSPDLASNKNNPPQA